MAVQPQTPYKEYDANGVATSFALEFDCEKKDHLIVTVDGAEPPIETWSLNSGHIVFASAPAAGKKIEIKRNTPYSRSTNFQVYDNSFRPGPVNGDFDRIWWKLQELGVADWILGTRIDALKKYVDRKDDELKAYLMEEIRKQGVALDQLDEYYNYLMERLAQIAVDKGWDASFVVDASGMTQQEINDNGFVLVDSRKLGLIGGIENDQSAAVAACNNYVNAIPIHKDTPVVLRLPKGLIRSSVGFAFDRQAILLADGDSIFDYTGNGYAVRLGKLGVTDYTDGFRTFGIKGVCFTGADNCTHGIYVSQYVLAPTLESVKFNDFGNPNNTNSFCVFFQAHNWDIYIRNCKADWITKNKVNLIRINGVLTDGTPDYGNSRLNLIDSFYNQGFNASAGIGLYLNSFKSRLIGGGFQGFKTSVQLGEYAQTIEVNGTYFETIYQDCESVFKIGDDGYTSEKVFSDLSLLNIYANLHNENNEYGNTEVKFLTTANNVKLSNLKIDNIKTLNGSKYPLLSLKEFGGQTCDVGNVSHANALLHNVRDDQMVVVNSSKNYIHNSDFRVWQRGSTFTFNNGKKHLADGYTLLSDGTTGTLRVFNEPLQEAYKFNSNAQGMMRLARQSATNATYNTLRIRVGEIEDLAGQFATFSFAAKSDTPLNITATFVQDYGNGNVVYTSIGSLSVVQGAIARNYAKSFFVANINRALTKTAASRTYIDIVLPLNTYVLDITCITLEKGYVRKGWSSNSYREELEFAKQYYQFGIFQSIQDQTRVQLNLRPVMRYSPTSVVRVTYQDAVVDYNANINVSETDRIVYTLNARSQDVSVSWTADAEL